MAKILCVLYDDPVDGYPASYARDDIPALDRYPGGQTLPTPDAIDYRPGELRATLRQNSDCRRVPARPVNAHLNPRRTVLSQHRKL